MAELTKLDLPFAARIEGIDAASDADVAFIRAALIENCVLVLPGQALDCDQQADFAARDAASVIVPAWKIEAAA